MRLHWPPGLSRTHIPCRLARPATATPRRPSARPQAVAQPSGSATAAHPSAEGAAPSPAHARLERLREEREAARVQLEAADQALRAELSTGASSGAADINFGFIRQFSGEPFDMDRPGGVPGGLMEMGVENFLREGRELLAAMGFTVPTLLRGPQGASPPRSTFLRMHRFLGMKVHPPWGLN